MSGWWKGVEKNSFKIPGTNIKLGEFIGSFTDGFVFGVLSPLLGLGSGLLLSQITHIADSLTKETIQNWVKRSYIDPPRNGRFYDENQVARILIFNSLRRVLELDDIKLLLQYSAEASGGALGEKELLSLFNDSVIKTGSVSSGDLAGYEKTVGKELALSLEKKGGDVGRIKEVIYIMLTAYQSGLLKRQAENLIYDLKAAGRTNYNQ
jgi:DNA-binding transcriptional MerR regulator